MGYIYCADVYCDECGDSIRESLRAEGKGPIDELDQCSYDSDDFPKDTDVKHEESDTPEHCAKCHVFLHNPLTSYGYTYVQDKLNESGESSLSKLTDVLRQWAAWYSFTWWDAEDCADDLLGKHSTVGWYSNESF